MVRHGASRRRIARALNAAYADGLLSDDTFSERLDSALAAPVIDPVSLIGDLSVRVPDGWGDRARRTVARARDRLLARIGEDRSHGAVLALDWSGHAGELILGRHPTCGVVVADPTVSRRHARLVFRDGSWVLQDLASTNGTLVNGIRVGRCALRPGDTVTLGDQRLTVD